MKNIELTMVRPNILAARPIEESTSFRLFRWKICIPIIIVTLTALFLSRGVQESENKLKIKPSSSYRQQQGVNRGPVDEECDHAVNRLVSSKFSANDAVEMIMLSDYDMIAHTAYSLIVTCRRYTYGGF
jgi:hypothetical protein